MYSTSRMKRSIMNDSRMYYVFDFDDVVWVICRMLRVDYEQLTPTVLTLC